MKRNFRLTRSTDFKRVRNLGKSYSHPLVVLVATQSEHETTRIGVAAARALGGAVERNRAKRILRETARSWLPVLQAGWDCILIARQPLLRASFTDVQSAVSQLLNRAKLVKIEHES